MTISEKYGFRVDTPINEDDMKIRFEIMTEDAYFQYLITNFKLDTMQFRCLAQEINGVQGDLDVVLHVKTGFCVRSWNMLQTIDGGVTAILTPRHKIQDLLACY